MSEQMQIYTDGACRGNPGIGGWGALLLFKDHSKELYGGEQNTTNNRMELLAAINALEALKRPCELTLYTDSQYMRKGITEWISAWKERNWRTAAKQPVKNQDLWQALDAQVQRHSVHWVWVKGHAGNVGNERADALANKGIDELKS